MTICTDLLKKFWEAMKIEAEEMCKNKSCLKVELSVIDNPMNGYSAKDIVRNKWYKRKETIDCCKQ